MISFRTFQVLSILGFDSEAAVDKLSLFSLSLKLLFARLFLS